MPAARGRRRPLRAIGAIGSGRLRRLPSRCDRAGGTSARYPVRAACARERTARHHCARPCGSDRGREPVVRRRPQAREAGQDRLRAPLRAHDVPGLGARRRAASTSASCRQRGGTLNGSTWLDRTNYFETLPTNELELALWLEADRMASLLPAHDRRRSSTTSATWSRTSAAGASTTSPTAPGTRSSRSSVPGGPPVSPLDHRLDGGSHRRRRSRTWASSSRPTTARTTRCSRSPATSSRTSRWPRREATSGRSPPTRTCRRRRTCRCPPTSAPRCARSWCRPGRRSRGRTSPTGHPAFGTEAFHAVEVAADVLAAGRASRTYDSARARPAPRAGRRRPSRSRSSAAPRSSPSGRRRVPASPTSDLERALLQRDRAARQGRADRRRARTRAQSSRRRRRVEPRARRRACGPAQHVRLPLRRPRSHQRRGQQLRGGGRGCGP